VFSSPQSEGSSLISAVFYFALRNTVNGKPLTGFFSYSCKRLFTPSDFGEGRPPLFSYSYKRLFLQLLSFDTHTNARGSSMGSFNREPFGSPIVGPCCADFQLPTVSCDPLTSFLSATSAHFAQTRTAENARTLFFSSVCAHFAKTMGDGVAISNQKISPLHRLLRIVCSIQHRSLRRFPIRWPRLSHYFQGGTAGFAADSPASPPAEKRKDWVFRRAPPSNLPLARSSDFLKEVHL
jgi:hypothetical protein